MLEEFTGDPEPVMNDFIDEINNAVDESIEQAAQDIQSIQVASGVDPDDELLLEMSTDIRT